MIEKSCSRVTDSLETPDCIVIQSWQLFSGPTACAGVATATDERFHAVSSAAKQHFRL